MDGYPDAPAFERAKKTGEIQETFYVTLKASCGCLNSSVAIDL